jgi:NadR type nicotinamide-nucleotide adenylyltransferase
VCVLGAESTGKTTLCRDVAALLGVPFLPEFGRHYTEAIPDARAYAWTHEDFRLIAATQNRFEDELAGRAPVVICDTNAFTTAVFEREYLGEESPQVTELWTGRSYDLYVLTDLGTPFVEDGTTGLRDPGKQRERMHAAFLAHVEASGTPWLLAAGPPAARATTVAAAIAPLLTERLAPAPR